VAGTSAFGGSYVSVTTALILNLLDLLLLTALISALHIHAVIEIGQLVIPGVILMIRCAVVAQAAAVERVDWLGALRRSGQLVSGNYLHVLGPCSSASASASGFSAPRSRSRAAASTQLKSCS
jgi:hypothetical protein